jgi:RNA polymerase sigma factor (sigma-70 family)
MSGGLSSSPFAPLLEKPPPGGITCVETQLALCSTEERIMSQTDAMLLEHWVRDRNADAFKLLATRYAAMVYHTCRRILGNPTEAEDVTQECFVILASTTKPVGGYLAPWLHRVAYNRSLARLRAEDRRREREARYASEQPTARDMAWVEIRGYVDEAIAELPDKLRVPVVAYFLDGQTHEGIAHALGIPRSTIAHRVDKGVEQLRRNLQGKGVAVAGTVLAGAIKANTAGAAAPSSVVVNLGKLALSGVNHVAWSAAAAPLAKTAAGFWTVKTMLAAGAGLAVVLGAACHRQAGHSHRAGAGCRHKRAGIRDPGRARHRSGQATGAAGECRRRSPRPQGRRNKRLRTDNSARACGQHERIEEVSGFQQVHQHLGRPAWHTVRHMV